jgi:hypothetical protein
MIGKVGPDLLRIEPVGVSMDMERLGVSMDMERRYRQDTICFAK